MSKKGGKKAKRSKSSHPSQPPPTYTLITINEVEELEQRYTNRINELRANALLFFSEVSNECRIIDDTQHQLDVWNDYVNCDHIPKPYLTADIRKFLTKQNYDENRKISSNIDWVLSVDECSILNQSIYRTDKTRNTILEKNRHDFGKDYQRFIDDALNLIKRIEYFLCDPSERAVFSKSVIEDILNMKPLLHGKIKDVFNCYTYRLLCNEEAYMDSIDAISSEYTYTCKNFDIHIWSLKDVPIRFTHMSEPRMLANLYNLNVILHIPFSMLRLELTIQGIHMNFDIFSEYATILKSREVNMNLKNHHDNIPNLSDCLYNELALIREIQERVRDKLILLRDNYDEKVKQIQEHQEKEAKRAKINEGEVKKPQIKLPAVAPQIVGPDEYPDVYVDFIKEENERYRRFLDVNYNPQNFNLLEDEINLKKYVLLGGVYQLFCVQKPKHYGFNLNRFNMTTHSPQRNLIIETEFYVKIEPQERKTKLSRIETEPITLKSLTHDEIDPNNPWFVVVFSLPKDLCLWSEPIACHFETTEIEVLKYAPKVKSSTSVTKIRGTKSKHLIKYHKDNEVAVADKGHATMDTLRDIHIPSVYEDVWGDEFGQFIPDVKDFPLNGSCDIAQRSLIERFCVPQIISSYKFPREINEDIQKHEERKPKGKGGILISKPTPKTVEITNALFSYDEKQTNPERVFPVYMRPQMFNIHHRLEPYYDTLPYEPKSFYQLTRVLTLIKYKFKERPKNIINLPDFQMPLTDKSRRKYKKTIDTTRSITLQRSLSHKSVRPSLEIRLSNKATKNSISSISLDRSSIHSQSHFALHEKKDSDAEKKEEIEKQTVTKWTTRHIRNFHFKKDECTCTIETDRLGCIGFAFKRYIHFPFKYWELQPSETDPQNEVIFTLETQFVKCVLKFTGDGISGYVTDIGKKYVRNPKMYLVIDQPIRDYKEFKKLFKEKNINIFAEDDASFYIENGNFCEKHLPLELHTYNCMAINCTQIKFNHNIWNCLAERRDIVLEFVGYLDIPDSKITVHLTPEQAVFVEITELCTMDLSIIELQYKPTWRNIGIYYDLHQLLVATYPAINDYRCKNAKLVCYLREVLREIRPFSFS